MAMSAASRRRRAQPRDLFSQALLAGRQRRSPGDGLMAAAVASISRTDGLHHAPGHDGPPVHLEGIHRRSAAATHRQSVHCNSRRSAGCLWVVGLRRTGGIGTSRSFLAGCHAGTAYAVWHPAALARWRREDRQAPAPSGRGAGAHMQTAGIRSCRAVQPRMTGSGVTEISHASRGSLVRLIAQIIPPVLYRSLVFIGLSL